jgi:hypothetical protein
MHMADRSNGVSTKDDLKRGEVTRRFDDTYKILLIIGPVLSFSLSSYSESELIRLFVSNVGFQFLVLSALLWALPNLFARKWQYILKMAGFVLIVNVFTILTFIVFERGTLRTGMWYLLAIAVAMIMSYYTATLLEKAGSLVKRDVRVLAIYTILVGVAIVAMVRF